MHTLCIGSLLLNIREHTVRRIWYRNNMPKFPCEIVVVPCTKQKDYPVSFKMHPKQLKCILWFYFEVKIGDTSIIQLNTLFCGMPSVGALAFHQIIPPSQRILPVKSCVIKLRLTQYTSGQVKA